VDHRAFSVVIEIFKVDFLDREKGFGYER
jgi:hypothetical protein